MADIAAGDEGALAVAYSQHVRQVHALARGLCGQRNAEDLTQEIFLQLWVNPQRYDAERGSLRSFLLLQTHSRAVELLRRDTARAARESADSRLPRPPPPEHDAATIALIERAEVYELVTKLPATQRLPIVLAYFGNLTYREVAELLSLPEGTVKTRIRSGLTHLRNQLATSSPTNY